MPSLTIKSIPEELLERLRQSAKQKRRSLNSEVLICLERSLELAPINVAPLDAKAFLRRVEELNREARLSPLTDEMLDRAKNHGRP